MPGLAAGGSAVRRRCPRPRPELQVAEKGRGGEEGLAAAACPRRRGRAKPGRAAGPGDAAESSGRGACRRRPSGGADLPGRRGRERGRRVRVVGAEGCACEDGRRHAVPAAAAASGGAAESPPETSGGAAEFCGHGHWADLCRGWLHRANETRTESKSRGAGTERKQESEWEVVIQLLIVTGG